MNIRDLIPWHRGRSEVSTRPEATNPIVALQGDINRMFEDFWREFGLTATGGSSNGAVASVMPRVDVRESAKEVEVIAELPGMDEGDVDVSLAEGMLTLRGERKAERTSEERGYVLRERRYGRVERVVALPPGLDLDAAKATFKNGVLTVTIPRTAEAQAAVKRIPVQRQ